MDDIYWTNYYIETILRNVREDEERKIRHNNQEVKSKKRSEYGTKIKYHIV